MACAFTGPISGSASSCSFVAVLMLIFVPGASFEEEEEEEEDFLEGEEGSDTAEVLPEPADAPAAAPAAAGAPTPSLSFRTFFKDSSFLPEPTPLTFETSSHVLYGRFLTSSFASLSPTTFAPAIVFSSAVFRLTFSTLSHFDSDASEAGVGVFFEAEKADGAAKSATAAIPAATRAFQSVFLIRRNLLLGSLSSSRDSTAHAASLPGAPGALPVNSATDAEAHRHQVHPRPRVGADRDRPGLRVRLFRHAGLPGA